MEGINYGGKKKTKRKNKGEKSPKATEFIEGKRGVELQVKCCTNAQSGPNTIISVTKYSLFIPCLFYTSLMHAKYLQFSFQFIALHWQQLYKIFNILFYLAAYISFGNNATELLASYTTS